MPDGTVSDPQSPGPGLMRRFGEAAALFPRERLHPRHVHGLPSGDGSAVLVLPAFMHDDGYTKPFRFCLQALGYKPLPWELGENWGPSPRVMEMLAICVPTLAAEHGRLRVVGFGSGGLLARWVAQARSQSVRQVITVCSPFRDPLGGVWARWRALQPAIGVDANTLAFMIRQRPEMEWAAIYSRLDGVSDYRLCMDKREPARCPEVAIRHRHAVREASVFRAVATSLSEVA